MQTISKRHRPFCLHCALWMFFYHLSVVSPTWHQKFTRFSFLGVGGETKDKHERPLFLPTSKYFCYAPLGADPYSVYRCGSRNSCRGGGRTMCRLKVGTMCGAMGVWGGLSPRKSLNLDALRCDFRPILTVQFLPNQEQGADPWTPPRSAPGVGYRITGGNIWLVQNHHNLI
jgi:hypothetical protein